MFGFLNVNKPAGPTSHDVVAAVRRILPRKTKVGHSGTLDPFARGVLVLCVGPATRLADYVQAANKHYRAAITLGAISSTDDTEGQISPAHDATPPTLDRVRDVLGCFVGRIDQVPPSHSAVHVNGHRAYKLARAGQQPRLRARTVTVHAIDLVRYDWPLLEIDLRCGTGTYIRAIARDVGAALDVGGYCSALTRTAVGPFPIDSAVRPEDLDPPRQLLPPLCALEHMPKVTLAPPEAALVANGRTVSVRSAPAEGEVAAVTEDGQLLAIAAAAGGTLRPTKVFPASA